MTTMTNSVANGRKRPSLDEQINRLDTMLDGLSEGLNEAVADAVRGAVGVAVKEAVQVVLTEVLNKPEILARLRASAPLLAATAPVEVKTLTIWQRLHGWLQSARACVNGLRAASGETLSKLQTSAADAWQRTCAQFGVLWAHRDMIRPFKYEILAAFGVGVLVGIAVWYAGPWLAAAVSAIGGFVTALAVQAGLWLRRMLTANVELLA